MALPVQNVVPRMRVLLAEDEGVTQRLLEAQLKRAGYEPVTVSDGQAAWEMLQSADAPQLVLLDWNMPGLDGPEICRRLRALGKNTYTYMVLVTARNAKRDVVEGLSAGADDFVSKPVDADELQARLRTGERIVQLEQSLQAKMNELRETNDHVKELQGLIPICMHCKRIRNQEQLWEKIETYIEHRSDARFSHALCTDCFEKHYPEHSDEPKEE